MPTDEQPKEALTQVEAERIDVPEKFVGYYRGFAERYGKEIADYFFQDKIELKKLLELFGIKLKKHYLFPELENSLETRLQFAQAIDFEGSLCIYVYRQKQKNVVRCYLRPSISLGNTSKELADVAASWMNRSLPNPSIPKEPNHAPCYQVARDSTPAIDLICLARPLLTKRKNIEKADKVIELFKERPALPCDENGGILSRPEPMYVRAYRLRQEGARPKEIAQKLGRSRGAVYYHIYRAKNLESVRKWERMYQRERREKSVTKLLPKHKNNL